MEKEKNIINILDNYHLKENYLNGRRWNGIGYNENNNEVYKLKNGKGIIKEYYYDDSLHYEGGYLNGEINGNFKKYSPEGK